MASAALRFLTSSSRSIFATPRSSSLSSRKQWIARRNLHTRKELPYKIEDGLGDFMSPRTLQMVAVEYQQGLLDRLNEYLRDAEDNRKTIAQVVLDTAELSDKTMTFKYASHALNNSFFLNCLRPPTDDFGENAVGQSILGSAIRMQFGNFDALRSQFSAAVYGMSGSGYLWFVTDAKRNLAFVPTFAAGTLLVRSRSGTVDPITEPAFGEGSDIPLPNQHPSQDRQQHPPFNPAQPPSSNLRSTPSSSVSGAPRSSQSHYPSSPPFRTLHTSVTSSNIFTSRPRTVFDPAMTAAPVGLMNESDMRDLKNIGEYIYPLFCVSVHEHCWLLDHGIWGKEKYMKEFWSVLDWEQVTQRFDTFNPVGRI
ncbi:hypothetical protein ID866_10917 [Astraeus odoratus]|nr:hypothetical protein ID866_10917 [Astraeus odoratus]